MMHDIIETDADFYAISGLDTQTGTIVATVTGISGPLGVALTPDGRKAYFLSTCYGEPS
jgi:DNA-binding beta-propeller fold protein YncE